MAVKRITRRWLFNSLGVILIILVALEVAFALSIKSFYYNNVRQFILSQSSIMNTLVLKNLENSAVDFGSEIRNLVENFTNKDKMEVMAINLDGKVTITSSGFEPNNEQSMPDYTQAVASSSLIGEYRGMMNGENIMAISVLSPVSNSEISAMRYVVSLKQVDYQIYIYILITTLLGIAIIFFVVMSSSYFINSIVIPVGEIGKTARKIAQGNFGVRLQKKNDDEIGELCDVINYMAEELSKAERLKNDFISSVSHELRTPLTAIKGWGETLMYDTTIDPEMLQKGTRVIVNETERLSTMVEELLDFSRMQSGRFKLIMGKIDILAEVSEAVLMYTQRAQRENKLLIFDEPDLSLPVLGDKNKLRQVFVNIIDNALKYSDDGDQVTILCYAGENDAVIIISDTGCGISSSDLPNVKTKFYKANATRRGSGIGLAVADEIIKMHGGVLELTSTESVGTSVEIRLPILKKNQDITQISEATN